MLTLKKASSDPKQILLDNIRSSFVIGILSGAEVAPENIQIRYEPYRTREGKEVSFLLKDFDEHIASLTDDDVKNALLFLCPESDRRRWTEEALTSAKIAREAEEAKKAKLPKDLDSYILGLEKASEILSEMGYDSGDEYDAGIRAAERCVDDYLADLRKRALREKLTRD